VRRALALLLALAAIALSAAAADGAKGQVRLKDLGRIDGWRDNSLVGYGLVTGLAGTGDSLRNKATRQSIANMLTQFGINLSSDQVQSRNVAAVMVMATLPPFAHEGSKLDVTVTSLGDARSLLGGALLLAPLKGPDNRVHALAQGPISVGGYKYDLFGNVVQKNHPTTGLIPAGAVVEAGVPTHDLTPQGTALFVLSDPDYTTASRIADSINRAFAQRLAKPKDAATIEILVPLAESRDESVSFLTRIENLAVEPDQRARVVINERTGMVVSGGDVRISQVTIAHGELKVSIVTDYNVSQPYPAVVAPYGPVIGGVGGGRTVVVPQTRIDVTENETHSVSLPGNDTVADLVRALGKIKTSPRDMISILQGIKAAGALHADLIIQ
jgi:flagellar P-ring protein precursor FlgI